MPRNTLVCVTATTLFHVSRVVTSSASVSPMPALLTRMSSSPNVDTTVSIASAHSCSLGDVKVHEGRRAAAALDLGNDVVAGLAPAHRRSRPHRLPRRCASLSPCRYRSPHRSPGPHDHRICSSSPSLLTSQIEPAEGSASLIDNDLVPICIPMNGNLRRWVGTSVVHPALDLLVGKGCPMRRRHGSGIRCRRQRAAAPRGVQERSDLRIECSGHRCRHPAGSMLR